METVTITEEMLLSFMELRHKRIQTWNRYGQAKTGLKGLTVKEYITLSCSNCGKVFKAGDVALIRKCGRGNVLYFCKEECRRTWEESRLGVAKTQMRVYKHKREELTPIKKIPGLSHVS